MQLVMMEIVDMLCQKSKYVEQWETLAADHAVES